MSFFFQPCQACTAHAWKQLKKQIFYQRAVDPATRTLCTYCQSFLLQILPFSPPPRLFPFTAGSWDFLYANDRTSFTPWLSFTSFIARREGERKRRKNKGGVREQVTAEYLLLSGLFLPNSTERWVGGVGYWHGRFIFLSLSLCLNWGQGLQGLLYCAAGKLPIRPTLIEHWKQSFIKKLICYSLPLTHSVFFLPHSSAFFHGLTPPHSDFLSQPFLQLSLNALFILLSAYSPPETWRLGSDIIWPFLSPQLCVSVKSLLVSQNGKDHT